MKKPAWRPPHPAAWRPAREPWSVVDRLDGLSPLTADQVPEVLVAHRIARATIRRGLRGYPGLRDEADGLADQAAVEAVATYRPGPRSIDSWAYRVALWTLGGARKVARRVREVRYDGEAACSEPCPGLAAVEVGDALAAMCRRKSPAAGPG